ncbi:hypothetical protein FHT78_000357 [Rhizobium sp. BK196]|uniref:hypothetical protein n=1 Tax=Rhizobium sp. BK196 TaxID=2587073 RepID=UPI001823BC82|nr:hypothetical protein [Rhizobium sp. BK196]MBB3308628.1 hypothetical protein [Rhizobium sp. BK196]
MASHLRSCLLAALVTIACAGIAAAEEMPAFWKKSMTGDPATNHYLAEAVKPLDNPDAQTLRVVKLANTLATLCSGASLDKKALYAYMTATRFAEIKGKAYNEAAFLADSSFRYFDYRALAHLCAGSAYLFGPQGHLAPGLLEIGKAGKGGRPAMGYDPANPLVILPPIARKS